MTDTVRIMPRQPIEAEPPMFPDAWERPVWRIPDCDGDGVAVPQADWVEVSDPIVWDGTQESLDAIAAALPAGARAAGAPTNNKLPMYINLGHGDSVRVPVGWRISVDGDSVAILSPSEVK